MVKQPLQATFTRVWSLCQALMELGSSAALQAAERAQQLEPKDAKVLELYLGDWSVARGMGK